jgi:RimJ/RimL family protein N-acetyltransferase
MREFTPADIAPYAVTIADPEVMRFMGLGWRYRLKRRIAGLIARVSHAEARLDLRRIRRHWERHGWGEWAVEERAGGALIGRVGFKHHPDFTADPTRVEIGWLIARKAWGRGYATEAAEMALAAGFERFGLERVISISSPGNERSIGVMRRLGMTEAGRTRWKGQDVLWTVTDRAAWESRAALRSAEAR